MTRTLVVGLPRSGTTWLARLLSSTPGTLYVHEPDNMGLNEPARFAQRGLGPLPSLPPGRRAPDYELLWDVAFRGGFPVRSPAPRRLLALSEQPRLAPRARFVAYRGAMRLASRAAPAPKHVLVKTVRAYLATEWLADRYAPKVIVVSRHPLNLLSAWLRQGWTSADISRVVPPVADRFSGTPLWPPPSEPGPEAAAWISCALCTLLLETAERHPEWRTVSHEQTCIDPAATLVELLAELELGDGDGDEKVVDTLARFNRPGEGWETERLTADEPERWRERLSADEAAVGWEMLDRFAAESPVDAHHWARAPVGR